MTVGVSAPKTRGFLSGIGTAFSTGAAHKLDMGALVQEATAIHVKLVHSGSKPSISTKVAALRRSLLHGGEGELGSAFRDVADVSILLLSQYPDINESTGKAHARSRGP